MIQKNTTYEIINASSLSDDVQDELCDNNINGGCLLVNPQYYPKFKEALSKEDFEIKCYFIYWNW